MDALSTALSCLLCATTPTTMPAAVARWEPIIAAASLRFDVPTPWIARVMAAESGGLTMFQGKPITSSAGAMGLMQIMPQTYASLRARYGLGTDAYDPHDNIFAGTAYLHELYQRYGYPNLFAAYNAGPSRLDDLLTRGRALPRVTEAYVASLTGAHLPSETPLNSPGNDDNNASSHALFFVNRAAGPEGHATVTASSLFVTLSSAAH